ncbi:TetR family transcriptional regulator [Streptomyces sp. LN500]|uniref:TetR/AcrR family transcriptional regulator n=1 Tax=Streptomyces sp. LN500 TaxID=3112978 RepID=UPI00371DCAE1
MGSRTAADTRDRIVTAAMAEFAQYGIAGARVDRIAKEARTSKERVYAYFRSKEDLYAFVARQELTVVAAASRMDPTDLPGYAGRIFDFFLSHPEHHRLVAWGRLELGDNAPAPDDPLMLMAAVKDKTEQLRKAQEDGYLDPSWDPFDILPLVHQIATSWAAQPELAHVVKEQARTPDTAARRAAVVRAVQLLFPAATRDETASQ